MQPRFYSFSFYYWKECFKFPEEICIFCQITIAKQNSNNGFTPSGSVYGKIFTNFNTSLRGPEKQTAFEERCAYLGYKYFISPEFAAEVKIENGPTNEASQKTVTVE